MREIILEAERLATEVLSVIIAFHLKCLMWIPEWLNLFPGHGLFSGRIWFMQGALSLADNTYSVLKWCLSSVDLKEFYKYHLVLTCDFEFICTLVRQVVNTFPPRQSQNTEMDIYWNTGCPSAGGWDPDMMPKWTPTSSHHLVPPFMSDLPLTLNFQGRCEVWEKFPDF